MADTVMRMASPAVSGQSRKSGIEPLPSSSGTGPGKSLDPATRTFMESRFHHDFAGVRIHDDARAAESARSLDALAYTYGSDIVFDAGRYDPRSHSGKHLLAHELAHVVQQGSGKVQKKISRATAAFSNQVVTMDYADVMKVSDTLAEIKKRIEKFTGTPPVLDVVQKITALELSQRSWLLYAIDVLMENTTTKHNALGRNDAIDKLIAQAAVSTTTPVQNKDKIDASRKFVQEVMLVSGWTAVAVAGDVTAPNRTDRAAIRKIFNPAEEDGDKKPFEKAKFDQDMNRLLKDYLQKVDPKAWGSTGTQSLTEVGNIADIVFEEAKAFFYPYVTASTASIVHLKSPWKPSKNVVDANKVPANKEQRTDYVRSRASKILWNDTVRPGYPEKDLFVKFHYNDKRDGAYFNSFVESIESDPVQQPILDRIVTHTGWKNNTGNSTQIGISMEYDSSRDNAECRARWKTIDTLCHEVLHALVHPEFEKAADRQEFGQVATEGFTEVLGNELFNKLIIMKAGANEAFKAKLESGLSVPKCPPPPDGTIDYGTAGEGAEAIRKKIDYPAMKAAYFLGRHELAGF